MHSWIYSVYNLKQILSLLYATIGKLFDIHETLVIQKGGISYFPRCFAANFCLLSAAERAFEGFEGDFQQPKFQEAAHLR